MTASRIEAPRGRIEAAGLTLRYPLYKNLVADRLFYLLRFVLPALAPPTRTILDDLNFTIEPGEVVGIVGRNGAGKTSLLKIVSGLIPPNGGTLAASGHIMALLAMGVGFRPTYTGRENIAYGALLLGLSRRELAGIAERIIAFSELGASIDQPYFTYSSGMRARLAFSLATHVPADIVILDETLATGDIRFASKCYRRLNEIRESGSTILFVSHNLGEVARLTDRVLVLEGGQLVFDGDVFTGLERYERLVLAARAEEGDLQSGLTGVDLSFAVLDPEGRQIDVVEVGNPLVLRLTVEAAQDMGRCWIFLRIINVVTNQITCYLMLNRWADMIARRYAGDGNVEIPAGRTAIEWAVPNWVAGEGTYVVDAYLGPAVTPQFPDQSGGRFWRAVARFAAIYDNPYLKGAWTAVELPISGVTVRRES